MISESIDLLFPISSLTSAFKIYVAKRFSIYFDFCLQIKDFKTSACFFLFFNCFSLFLRAFVRGEYANLFFYIIWLLLKGNEIFTFINFT